jgi:hypothetical protein
MDHCLELASVTARQIATLGKKTAKRYSSSSMASVKRGSINPGSGGDDSDAAQQLETWILLELCDAGSLQVCTPCVACCRNTFTEHLHADCSFHGYGSL